MWSDMTVAITQIRLLLEPPAWLELLGLGFIALSPLTVRAWRKGWPPKVR